MDIRQRIKTIVSNLEHEVRISMAAVGMVTDSGYCDFFAENGGHGQPFYERCPEDVTGFRFTKEEFSAARMTDLARLGLKPSASDDYCDYFVENGGDGQPWHEQCPEANAGTLLSNPNPVFRNFALRRLGVIQAFTRAVDKVSGQSPG